RDACEREQEALDERSEAADALLVLLDLRRGVARLRRRRQQRLDLADERRRLDAALRLNADDVELAGPLQQPLRRRQIERGDRRAADRDARELDDPRDPEVLHRTAALDADRVADLEVLARCGVAVDRNLVASTRPRARLELKRIEGLVVGIDAE